MKKLTLILILLLTIGQTRVWAEEIFSYSYADDGTALTINGLYDTYSEDELVIPSSINGIPVKYIAYEAFRGLDITTLRIMSSDEIVIYNYAFADCTNLKDVYILASRVTFDGLVFQDDISLESFYLTNVEELVISNSDKNGIFNRTDSQTETAASNCTIYLPADFEIDSSDYSNFSGAWYFLYMFGGGVVKSGENGYDYAEMLKSLDYEVTGVTLEYVENENVTYDETTNTATTNYDNTDGITLKATVSLTYEEDIKYAVIDEKSKIATWTYDNNYISIDNCVVTNITGAPTTATITVTAGDFSDQITVNFADYVVGNPILPGYIVVLVGDSEPVEAMGTMKYEGEVKSTDLYYTYDDSQNDYATVEKDENGVIWVTGVKENSEQNVSISLSYDGVNFISIEIYVNDISEVTLDEEATINLSDGETEKTLTAAITWHDAEHIPPEGAMDVNDWVVWNSSDEKIATVENGTVTAVEAGFVEITVAPKNHPDQITSCIVTIKEIGSLTIPNINSMKIGDDVELPDVMLNWLPEGEEVIEKDDINLTWTAISVEGEEEITTGHLTATTTGIIQLYATYEYSENTTVTGITQVSVYEEIIQATTIILTDTVKMIVGETADLLIITDPSDATPQPTTWTSDNTEIVTVGQKELLTTTGLLTAISAGETTITVTYGDVSATCIVVVSEPNAIKNITSDVYEIARYNLAGQKISEAQKGINIVKFSDGTTKKVLVR